MNKSYSFFHDLPANIFSGFVVSLIALPLGLGLSLASGMPPISGIIAAVVGGTIVSLLGGSHVTIVGPGNGLVVVLLGAVYTLGGGDLTQGYLFTLAAIILSGVLLLLFGFLRLGGLSDFFPASAIQGMLAAIGLTILIKQFFVMVGDLESSGGIIALVSQIPSAILLPFVSSDSGLLAGMLIGVISLFIMVFYSKIRYPAFHFIPAPMWVVVFAVGVNYYYQFFSDTPFPVPEALMIQIPESLFDHLPQPDFSLLWTVPFWGVVLSITLIAGVESLLSVKAVDKLDPKKRRSNTNKDLKALGLATVISGFLGGMNVVTVIARSSVNVNNKATNRSSNFFHALFLLLFVIVFQDQIRRVPLTALAAILVYTGYKLASPEIFKKIAGIGREQLIIFLITLFTTLFLGLIIGIVAGVFVTFLSHIIINKSLWRFSRNILKPNVLLFKEEEKNTYYISVLHFCSFLNFYRLKDKINMVPQSQNLVVDFSLCDFVDHSVMEGLSNYQFLFAQKNGSFETIGLDVHGAVTEHPFAVRTLLPFNKRKSSNEKLTKRQLRIKAIGEQCGLDYNAKPKLKKSFLMNLLYFKTKTIVKIYNELNRPNFRFFDIHYTEGEFITKENIQASMLLFNTKQKIPSFTLEKEGLMERIYHIAGLSDIDLDNHPAFSKSFYLLGDNPKAIKHFFNDSLILFLLDNPSYHIESNGKEILIQHRERLTSVRELEVMLSFGFKLEKLINDSY